MKREAFETLPENKVIPLVPENDILTYHSKYLGVTYGDSGDPFESRTMGPKRHYAVETMDVSSMLNEIGHFFTLENDNRPHVDIELTSNGKSATGLVDTGAMTTIVGYKEEAELKKWSCPLLPSGVTITTADGTPHKAHGRMMIELLFAGECRTITVIAVRTGTSQLILGMNFCNAFGVMLTVA